jgi:hypothetical protein
MQGTLAPPPAYGSERGSILLQTGVPRSSIDRSRNEDIPEESPLISLENTSHIPHHQPPEYSSLPRHSVLARRQSDEQATTSDNDQASNENESDRPANSP